MSRLRRYLSCLILLIYQGFLSPFAYPAPERSLDSETRNFSISVDGKPAGAYEITIQSDNDNRTVMTARANVRVSYLLYTYTYSFQGSEIWQNGRLQRVECTSDDAGKRCTVLAIVQGDKAQLLVDGQHRHSSAPVWTTTYWQLPLAEQRSQVMTLLDVDSGANQEGKLRVVDTATITVEGTPLRCTHYRLAGPVPADLWFDEANRLVQQKYVDDGHPTELRLTRLRRTPPQ